MYICAWALSSHSEDAFILLSREQSAVLCGVTPLLTREKPSFVSIAEVFGELCAEYTNQRRKDDKGKSALIEGEGIKEENARHKDRAAAIISFLFFFSPSIPIQSFLQTCMSKRISWVCRCLCVVLYNTLLLCLSDGSM